MAAVRMFISLVALFAVSAVLVVVQADCDITKMTKCDSDSPDGVVQKAEFNGTCENSTTADGSVGEGPPTPVFFIGDTYETKINFSPKFDAEYAKINLKVKFGPFLIPETVDNPDACTNMGLTCPLKADNNYTFSDVFTVSPVMPVYRPINITLLYGLMNEKPNSYGSTGMDDDNSNAKDLPKSIFCIKFPVMVKPAPKHTPPASVEEPDFRVVN